MKVGWILCSAAAALAIAALARAPWIPAGHEQAWLRFSWRMNLVATEACRPRTDAELAELPVHMRTPEVCTSDLADYFLVLRIDTASADTVALVRGGVKGDRPLFVLEERRIRPGTHDVQVELVRAAAARTVLASLDTRITVRSGEIVLITLDRDGDRLMVRSADDVRAGGTSAAAGQPNRRDHDDDAEHRAETREQRGPAAQRKHFR